MIRIPAIDIINGTCVRLTKGEFDQSTTYNTDPLEIAKKYQLHGAEAIHIVDLDAARGIKSNKQIIFDIAEQTKLKIQVGGGIKTDEHVDEMFDKGVDAVIIGSLAQYDRPKVKSWIAKHGADKIILGADVRNRKIAVDGWLSTSDEDVTDFILDYTSAGGERFLCTDIQRDGTLQGSATSLYTSLVAKFPEIKLIASGGVADMDDIYALEKIGMHSVVIGKALFENKIELSKLFSN